MGAVTLTSGWTCTRSPCGFGTDGLMPGPAAASMGAVTLTSGWTCTRFLRVRD